MECPKFARLRLLVALVQFSFPSIFMQGEDEFLGVVSAKPTVRLSKECPVAELEWYTIDRYNKYAGDMLAAFELFWVSHS